MKLRLPVDLKPHYTLVVTVAYAKRYTYREHDNLKQTIKGQAHFLEISTPFSMTVGISLLFISL